MVNSLVSDTKSYLCAVILIINQILTKHLTLTVLFYLSNKFCYFILVLLDQSQNVKKNMPISAKQECVPHFYLHEWL